MIAGAGYLGWKTWEHGIWNSLKWLGGAAAAPEVLGGAAVLAGGGWAGATKSPMVDDYGRVVGNWGGAPFTDQASGRGGEAAPALDQLPGWREHWERAERSADEAKRYPEAARGRGYEGIGNADGSAQAPIAGWKTGEPIHVIIDGSQHGASAADGPFGSLNREPKNLSAPAPAAAATGGTVTPTLAQPPGPVNTTNNNDNRTTVNNTYHVSAPVTVNVAQAAQAPAAVGGAVASAVT